MSRNLVATNGLGRLVRIVTVGLLQLLNQLDISVLGLLGGDALVDNLLPCGLLGLALLVMRLASGCAERGREDVP